jgi:hypothetical protein
MRLINGPLCWSTPLPWTPYSARMSRTSKKDHKKMSRRILSQPSSSFGGVKNAESAVNLGVWMRLQCDLAARTVVHHIGGELRVAVIAGDCGFILRAEVGEALSSAPIRLRNLDLRSCHLLADWTFECGLGGQDLHGNGVTGTVVALRSIGLLAGARNTHACPVCSDAIL